MRLSLRSLLIWLMVLALPIQAVAAAGMQHCGAAHRLMQVAWTGAVAPDIHDPVHEATPHQHADTDTSLDAEIGAGDLSDEGPSATALSDNFTCSACANCCSAVALPAGLVRLPAPSIEAHAAVLPATEVVSFTPGGIERPPRTFLA
jgi:hypothetical protein